MMIIDLEPDIGLAPDAAAAIPDDPAWVAAGFAAIMMASGFGDRVIAATLGPRGLELGDARERPAAGRPNDATVVGSSQGARVRSPPRH